MPLHLDLPSFQQHLETLDLEPLALSPELSPTIASAFRGTGVSLHALPELHVAGLDLPGGESPQLRLLGKLGQGGMGVVHLANQIPLDRDVAVKTTHADTDEEAAKALLQEACVTGYLEHPNIIPIYTVGRTRLGAPLIVMKRVEGISWLDRLGRAERSGAPPADLDEHIEILIQVCNAVRFAHSRGIIHRDIKPDNVMIGHFGEVYLLDWGIAVSLREDRALLPRLSEAKQVAGTPHYLAPEMTVEDGEPLDERADIYLLGATLHHVLTGKPRHPGTHLLQVMFAAHRSLPYTYDSSVPADLARIAARACHPDRDQRFQKVSELRDALHDFLEHRASIALSRSAEEKLSELHALLGHVDAPPIDVTADEVQDLYVECRFGFYQALRIWPHNDPALAGLQSCLELMADYFLDRTNLDAARGCIAELPEPSRTLIERADALALQLQAGEEDLQRLKALERNLDMNASTSARSRLALSFAFVWTGFAAYQAYRLSTQIIAPTELLDGYKDEGLRNFAIAAIGLFLFRKRVFTNTANRRLVYMLLVTSGLVAFVRWGVWYTGGELAFARMSNYVIYAMGIIAVGVMSDLRICLIAGAFFATALVTVVAPDIQLHVAVLANAVTFGAFAWLWSPAQMKKNVSA